jgi:hypothetical protein
MFSLSHLLVEFSAGDGGLQNFRFAKWPSMVTAIEQSIARVEALKPASIISSHSPPGEWSS